MVELCWKIFVGECDEWLDMNFFHISNSSDELTLTDRLRIKGNGSSSAEQRATLITRKAKVASLRGGNMIAAI